jgi:hypothetical protein
MYFELEYIATFLVLNSVDRLGSNRVHVSQLFHLRRREIHPTKCDFLRFFNETFDRQWISPKQRR